MITAEQARLLTQNYVDDVDSEDTELSIQW